MNQILPLILLVSCFFLCSILLFYQANVYESVRSLARKNHFFVEENSFSCESEIAKWNVTVPSLLIDMEFLNSPKKCEGFESRIKIGIDVRYRNFMENNRFEIVYFGNDSSKDYLEFLGKPKRIIPRNFRTRWIGNVEVPLDIEMFEGFLKRSKFVECKNMTVNRTLGEPYMPSPPESSRILSLLRDEIIQNGMFPFLNGGTLLGWYRECSVIPHTTDMDMAIFAKDYKPGFLEKVQDGEHSKFRLYRKFGMVNDSFEMTVYQYEGARFGIDLFLMYEGFENDTLTHHWVGGVNGDGTKYKYSYDIYDPWCAADLHGYIFWVTCTPEDKIIKEYGPQWYLDHPTAYYAWNQSGKNVKENGKWTEEQMKEVYNVYAVQG